MQWQVTPSAFDVSLLPTIIQLIAKQETNPALYHYGVNKLTPEHFSTVILHDAVGLFHVSDLGFEKYNPMMQPLVIRLNLYMVNQNCKVSSVKHLLRQGLRRGVDALASVFSLASFPTTKTLRSGFWTFSGVIFVNGTVLDLAPLGFCRTCTF
ncbi:hypothetical protein N657DRAFT_649020 [Parathielavia appendiculata]|uniref:Uncharacterized protein n=1 Tax=Parathielavia appendiculata TaxID=2587402 RepID=A0AAN6TUK8_9PEZI|nr:hypothetical protein N657DRAFT_649020 [Parathielavia appendiculata]